MIIRKILISVLPIAGFHKMNEVRVANGEDPYMNPRNTASGSLKLQDSAETASRPLECYLYNLKIKDKGNTDIETQFGSLQNGWFG